MNFNGTVRRRRIWDLKDLVDYPGQQRYFEDLSPSDLDRLAEDIRRNRLQCPIEVLGENTAGLPPGTIVSGHQRRRAPRKLGKTKTSVYERRDLAGASREEIERAFIEANLNRRHLHPLDKARAVLRLYRLEKGKRRGGEARDRVGRAIGMTGRNLERYLKALEAPAAVQAALRKRELSLVLAAKVGGMEKSKQEEVARRIEGGERPQKVVGDLTKAKLVRPPSAKAAVADLAEALVDGMDRIGGRFKELAAADLAPHRTALLAGRRLLRRLVELSDG